MSTTKYLRYQHGVTQVNPSGTVHLRNSNKQHLILAKFYTNNKLFIGNKSAYFQLDVSKQTITTYSGFCDVTPKHFSFRCLRMTLDLKLECFRVTSQKQLCIVCFGKFYCNLAVKFANK